VVIVASALSPLKKPSLLLASIAAMTGAPPCQTLESSEKGSASRLAETALSPSSV
jgi:hypothetical protein